MIKNRIGIFSGSFDPIHKGHIAFALQAIDRTKLDEIYFLPEVKSRYKSETSHISHRLAMLELAIKPYSKLKILELPDRQFTVAKTLPRLKQHFKHNDLLLIIGSDVLEHIESWPLAESLIEQIGLIIGVRNNHKINKEIFRLKPKELFFIDSKQPTISSSQIRRAVKKGKSAPGSLTAVDVYIKKHWLYSAIPKSS
jgi:nicotinate-nucleotide adenylyltransferase